MKEFGLWIFLIRHFNDKENPKTPVVADFNSITIVSSVCVDAHRVSFTLIRLMRSEPCGESLRARLFHCREVNNLAVFDNAQKQRWGIVCCVSKSTHPGEESIVFLHARIERCESFNFSFLTYTKRTYDRGRLNVNYELIHS